MGACSVLGTVDYANFGLDPVASGSTTRSIHKVQFKYDAGTTDTLTDVLEAGPSDSWIAVSRGLRRGHI